MAISGHGAARARSNYGKDVIIWSKRAVPRPQLRRSELVFVGYGIVAPEYAWNDYAGIDVHGKTVAGARGRSRVRQQGSPALQGQYAERLRALGLQGRGGGAARRGGVLLVHDAGRAGLRLGRGAVDTGAARSSTCRPRTGEPARPSRAGFRLEALRGLFTGLELIRALDGCGGHAGFKAVPMGLPRWMRR